MNFKKGSLKYQVSNMIEKSANLPSYRQRKKDIFSVFIANPMDYQGYIFLIYYERICKTIRLNNSLLKYRYI